MADRSAATRKNRDEFLKRIDIAIQRAHGELEATQELYKRDCDKRVQGVNRRLRAGDYVYIDSFDGSKSLPKLQSSAKGPYRVISADC